MSIIKINLSEIVWLNNKYLSLIEGHSVGKNVYDVPKTITITY